MDLVTLKSADGIQYNKKIVKFVLNSFQLSGSGGGVDVVVTFVVVVDVVSVVDVVVTVVDLVKSNYLY